jgi:hypothetical protein
MVMFKHMALSFPRQSMTDLNILLARGSAKKINTFEALDAALLLRHMALAARRGGLSADLSTTCPFHVVIY